MVDDGQELAAVVAFGQVGIHQLVLFSDDELYIRPDQRCTVRQPGEVAFRADGDTMQRTIGNSLEQRVAVRLDRDLSCVAGDAVQDVIRE